MTGFIKRAALAAVGFAALAAATPAGAVLQISISDGINPVFTCHDGQLGCDLGGAVNNILTLNTSVGNFLVFGTLSFSSFGATNQLSLSSFGIDNLGSTAGTIKILVSDTNFAVPVLSVHESASLTFNNAVGSGLSTLKFWADSNNVQGANPINTPGTLLDTVSGTPSANPDSFSGSLTSPFSSIGAFSMTEGSAISLIGGGSITGYNQDMQTSSVPEAKTWAMLGAGFGLMGLLGLKRRKDARFAV